MAVSEYESKMGVSRDLALEKASQNGRSTWAFEHGRQQIQVTAEKIEHGRFKTSVLKLPIEKPSAETGRASGTA